MRENETNDNLNERKKKENNWRRIVFRIGRGCSGSGRGIGREMTSS